MRITAWQSLTIGAYEYQYEYTEQGYTGWHRCASGRLADGRWPEWNYKTGETRYS